MKFWTTLIMTGAMLAIVIASYFSGYLSFLVLNSDRINSEQNSSFIAGFQYGCTYYCGLATNDSTCNLRCSKYAGWYPDEYSQEHKDRVILEAITTDRK